MPFGVKRWLSCGLLGLSAAGLGCGDDPESAFTGLWLTQQLTFNPSGCQTEGPARTVGVPFLGIAPVEGEPGRLQVKFCRSVDNCRARLFEDDPEPRSFPDFTDGVGAFAAFAEPEDGICVDGFFREDRLLRDGERLTIETRIWDLPIYPAREGVCGPELAEAVARAVPCAELVVITATRSLGLDELRPE